MIIYYGSYSTTDGKKYLIGYEEKYLIGYEEEENSNTGNVLVKQVNNGEED